MESCVRGSPALLDEHSPELCDLQFTGTLVKNFLEKNSSKALYSFTLSSHSNRLPNRTLDQVTFQRKRTSARRLSGLQSKTREEWRRVMEILNGGRRRGCRRTKERKQMNFGLIKNANTHIVRRLTSRLANTQSTGSPVKSSRFSPPFVQIQSRPIIAITANHCARQSARLAGTQ